MAQEFKVTGVSPQTRSFQTQFGDMVSYKLNLEGVELPVELAQKTTTPPPVAGNTLYGSIDMSGQYGPKFKKEQRQEGGGGFTPNTAAPATATRPGVSSTPNGRVGSPNDEAIARAVALKAAVELAAPGVELDTVFQDADRMFAWLQGIVPATKLDEEQAMNQQQVNNVFGEQMELPL